MDYPRILLDQYLKIGKLVRLLDRSIVRYAVSSHCVYGIERSTIQQAEKIARLAERRDKYLMFRNVTKETLKKLHKDERLLLVLTCIRNADKTAVSNEMGISRRTLYRRLDSAMNSFSKLLKQGGYDEQWFEENFDNCKWLNELRESA